MSIIVNMMDFLLVRGLFTLFRSFCSIHFCENSLSSKVGFSFSPFAFLYFYSSYHLLSSTSCHLLSITITRCEHHRELEAELKKMAPPRMEGLFLFSEKSVAILLVG